MNIRRSKERCVEVTFGPIRISAPGLIAARDADLAVRSNWVFVGSIRACRAIIGIDDDLIAAIDGAELVCDYVLSNQPLGFCPDAPAENDCSVVDAHGQIAYVERLVLAEHLENDVAKLVAVQIIDVVNVLKISRHGSPLVVGILPAPQTFRVFGR